MNASGSHPTRLWYFSSVDHCTQHFRLIFMMVGVFQILSFLTLQYMTFSKSHLTYLYFFIWLPIKLIKNSSLDTFHFPSSKIAERKPSIEIDTLGTLRFFVRFLAYAPTIYLYYFNPICFLVEVIDYSITLKRNLYTNFTSFHYTTKMKNLEFYDPFCTLLNLFNHILSFLLVKC